MHGTTTLITRSTEGVQANQGSESAEITADGRYVVYWSKASNLSTVVTDTNSTQDIFVHDRLTGETVCASLRYDIPSQAGDALSSGPDISDDGRYVAFYSYSKFLVPGDTNVCPGNLCRDVFVRDLWTNKTTRVSVSSGGTQGDNHSNNPTISSDGRYVAFESGATNLITSDTNGNTDVFVHDRAISETVRVSVRTDGAQLEGGNSSQAAISGDGRYVAFSSFAGNVVPGDTGGRQHVYVRDRVTSTTVRVSVNSSGARGNGDSSGPSISDDGRYVAFSSQATNLVAGDDGGKADIFVHDMLTHRTVRVSVSSAGVQGSNDSADPAISPDGRYVVFRSASPNLVDGDDNGMMDIFLHDMATGQTTRASISSSGAQSNNHSFQPAVSAHGRAVAFHSSATTLASPDNFAGLDIFVHEPPWLVFTPLVLDGPGA